MKLPQIPSYRGKHGSILIAISLLLIGSEMVGDRVRLAHLAERVRANAQDGRVPALAARVGDVEQQLAKLQRQPRPVSQAEFGAARQALEARLSPLEQAQANEARADDVQALRAHLDEVEARLKATLLVPPSHRSLKPSPARVPKPPFRVVGLELRGNERLLSIMPPGVNSLAGVQLLREGDANGTWQLQALEGRTAVFHVDGQKLRIAIP